MSVQFKAKVHVLQNPTGSLVAFATLGIDTGEACVIEINGFRVVSGSNGLFVAAPSKKSNKKDEKTGKDVWFDDVRFSENKEEGQFRGPVADRAHAAILAAYTEATGTDTRQDSARANQNQPASTGARPSTPISTPSKW